MRDTTLRSLLLSSVLLAACSAAPIGGEARTLALNSEGLHLDVSATPGVSLHVGDSATGSPIGESSFVN